MPSITVKTTQKSHSSLGASGAARWWACPGSVALEAAVGESYESAAAQEGTAAHALAESVLKYGWGDPTNAVGNLIEGVRVTDDMVEAVSVFTNYCQERMGDSAFGVEEQFDLAALHP